MQNFEGDQTTHMSGLLNPLLEQIIKDLPTAPLSLLSTSTIQDMNSLKLGT